MRTTNKFPLRFNAVSISSNVDVNRRKVRFSLIDHRVVTSSIRAIVGTRVLSKVIAFTNYSGDLPKVVVTTTQLSITSIFICTNSVLPNQINSHSIAVVSTFRTINTYTQKLVAQRRISRVRHTVYPNRKTYNNVCATGAVTDVKRTVNLDLPNSTTPPTISHHQSSCTHTSKRTIIGLVQRNVATHRVVAGSTFRGTVAILVTLKKSAGTILRLLTVTRRTSISLRLRSFREVNSGIPLLNSLGPFKHCIVDSISQINNIPIIVGTLLSTKLLRNSYVAIANRAITRGLTRLRPSSPSNGVLRTINSTLSDRNKVAILSNSLYPRKTIIGDTNITIGIFRKATQIFRQRRSTVTTLRSNAVRTNSIIVVHCRKPGNNPKVHRVLVVANTVGNTKLKRSIVLVASKQFSKKAAKLYIKRITPRTISNKPVTFIRSNSQMHVSVNRHALSLLISSSRLRHHHRK